MVAAMILAAGLGTRLRPLTDRLPKPLVWVGDRPLLAHVVATLVRGGVTRIALNTHHLAEAFSPETLAALAAPVTVLHEPTILGTAGGVAHARAALGEGDVVVWNGDLFADFDVGALVAAHRGSGAEATLAVSPCAAGEGTVGLDRAGCVVRLRSERFGEEVTSAAFTGTHVIGPELRDLLPPVGCLVGDGYLPALRRGARIASFFFEGVWDDVGSIEAYLAANQRWLERQGLASYVAPSARVGEGVEIERSVIGSGAVVEGSGVLHGCVVWPGCVAMAPLSGRVISG
jgi:mannose-1-phosphate guanylyltransferase